MIRRMKKRMMEMILTAMAMTAVMVITMIALMIAMLRTERSGKGRCAGTVLPSHFPPHQHQQTCPHPSESSAAPGFSLSLVTLTLLPGFTA